MQKNVLKNDRFRLLIAALFLLLLFAIVLIKFYYIQVAETEHWQHKAKQQHYFTVEEPFRRGTFWASTANRPHPPFKQHLSFDLQQYQLYVDPNAFPIHKKDEAARELAIAMGDGTIEKNIKKQLYKKSRSRRIAYNIAPSKREEIDKWWAGYYKKNRLAKNAIYFQPDWFRRFPCETMAAPILHTVHGSKDEITKQAYPTGGLELFFNPFLKGQLGQKLLMRSPRHTFESGELLSEPIHGKDIVLTIDPYIQSIMEEELAYGVKRAQAKGGWALMLDPQTGRVLAIAQYPFFHPERFSDYFKDASLIERTRLKPITDSHEIGSVIKPLTMTLALQANEGLKSMKRPPLFSIQEKIATSNGVCPGRSKPLKDTSLHYYLNMYMAIQKSSNIYLARILDRLLKTLGDEWYRQHITAYFGLGVKTGIELPGESSGVIPTPGKKHPNGKLEWSVATPYSLAMGYNMQVTSVQMARAYAVLANGGYLVTPTIVDKIGDDPKIPAPKRQVISKSVVKEIVNAMRYTTQIGGSGQRANIPGYTEAGKSSTAKKLVDGKYSETQYLSSFIGFSPVENAAFVLIVTLDEPKYGFIQGFGRNHHGGNCSGSIFKQIGSRTLKYLGIAPDDPYGYPPGDPRRDISKAKWHAEAMLLQEMYQKWNNFEQVNSKI